MLTRDYLNCPLPKNMFGSFWCPKMNLEQSEFHNPGITVVQFYSQNYLK